MSRNWLSQSLIRDVVDSSAQFPVSVIDKFRSLQKPGIFSFHVSDRLLKNRPGQGKRNRNLCDCFGTWITATNDRSSRSWLSQWVGSCP